MADQAVVHTRVPQTGVGHRHAAVPGASLDHETRRAGPDLQFDRHFGRCLAGQDLVLGVSPRYSREQPPTRALGLERMARDSRCRVDIDQAFLELKGFAIRQMQAP